MELHPYDTKFPWPSQLPDDGDEGRQKRGYAIAAMCQIDRCPLGYRVPSQSGVGHYVVNAEATACSCPDFEKRRLPCKHVYAVRVVRRRENGAGTTATLVNVAVATPDAAGTPPPIRRKRGRPRKGPAKGQTSLWDLPVAAGTPPPARPIEPEPLEGVKPVITPPDDPETLSDDGPTSQPPDDTEMPPPTGSVPAPKPIRPMPSSGGLLVDMVHYQGLSTLSIDSAVSIPITGGWPVIARPDIGITNAVSEPTPNAKSGKNQYGRDYAGYNKAQTTEKAGFLKLLSELCDSISEEMQIVGRPRMPMREMVYSTIYKIYSLYSLRRFETDLKEAKRLGYITRIPAFNTISKYMNFEEMTPILHDLVTASAIPVKGLEDETELLMDSTGFSTCRFVNWHSKKHGNVQDRKEWVKGHLSCGSKSKIVTAVMVTGWEGEGAGDSPHFIPLLQRTMQNFEGNFQELMADKAYLSKDNLAFAMLSGLVPYIPFKSNSVTPAANDGSAWAIMYDYFTHNTAEFYDHYHRRSNVESCVHMIKSKFGDSIRSKNWVAQVNEVLAKVICHNIVELHKLSVMTRLSVVFERKRK